MVGLGWGSLLENAPESGDPVASFAPQHPLGAKVDGGIRVQLKQEEVVVIDGIRWSAESEQLCDAGRLATRRLGESG